MMRTKTALVGTAVVGMLLASAAARAEPPAAAKQQVRSASATDVSAQRRLKRIPIYPREEGHWQPDVVPHYYPGPNAVRVCNAHYVQEARPSGTVIVPHMSCYWRG